MATKKKTGLRLLVIALIIVICGSLLANLFNTGMWSVKVSRISFETANGELSGLLYMPKGASASNPRPTVVVTHGYLNSAEMQDANAIELSRRGYVVLALDMYDHGHSDINDEAYGGSTGFMATWAPFWIHSMYDAVQYMYDQPYVLKDEAGNGIIGVTGHSMGGFSSTMAVFYDELDYATNGYRKILANLTEGSDFQYTGIVAYVAPGEPSVTAADFDAAGGGRTLGKVAAEFDEFFFNDPTVQGGTVRQKNYVATPDGMTFLQQQESAQANTWYETSDGGQRIIYQPHQTHPWNHFSKTTTGYALEFYTKAFEGYQADIKTIAPSSQIWQLKEAAECVALVGFVLFIIALALVLVDLPFFSKAKTGELAVARSTAGAARKACNIIVTIIAILLPAILFETLYGGNPASTGMKIVFWCALALMICGIVYAAIKIVKGGDKKRYILGAVFTAIAGAALLLISKSSLYANTGFWTAPVVNDVAKWTIGCAFIALMIMALVYVFDKAQDGVGLAEYGVKLNVMAIVAGICEPVKKSL